MISVILVDDHKIVREGLRMVLDRHDDIEVAAEADSGRQAVELARTLRPDIIIMDIAMEGLNGIDAARQILRDDPDARVIALSAYADRRYVLGMLEAGASGYVLKANAGDELIAAIRSVMQGNKFLTPEVTDMVVGSRGRSETLPIAPEDSPLSAREREVLQLLAEGKSSKEIAGSLFISVRTAETHRRNIVRKLNLHSIAELTKYAIREGLTRVER